VKSSFGAAALNLCLCLGLCLASGCSKASSDNDAIRAAIVKHLTDRGGLNMAAMDVNVKQVSVNGDQAQAQVEFRPKQGGGGMQVAYTLQRVQGAWVVAHGQPAGGEISHPPMDRPPTAAPAPGAAPTAGATPEFPSMDKFKKPGPAPGSGALPPGHPPTAKPADVPQ
jgi:hypothetical protein